MNLRSVDLNLIPIFDILMKERHLSRAAQRLHMSQPAMSNALKRLRASFNDELFVRTASGLVPTQRAREIYPPIKEALELIQTGYSTTEWDPAHSEYQFTIALNSALELAVAPTILAFLETRAPNTVLKFCPDQPQNIPQLLRYGSLDFALDFLSFDPDIYSEVVVAREDLAVIARRDHPDIGEQLSIKQFETLSHAALLPRDETGTPVEQLLGREKIHRKIKVQVAHVVSLVEIVAASNLISIVPKKVAERETYSERIKVLPMPISYPPLLVKLIWHNSRENDTVHRWFRSQIIDSLRELAGYQPS